MQFYSLRTRIKVVLKSASVCLFFSEAASAADIPLGKTGFESQIKPFFKNYCIECHGPEKSKGKITLHSLDGDLARGQDLERWELILDVLEHEDMPPEGEENRPSAENRAATIK